MSVWSTKSTGRARDYVVIKHKMRGVNANVGGVRFRDSFGVVEKGSKTYLALKRMPIIQKEDLPLEILRKLPFITRTQDIETVFGREVYVNFLSIFEKVQEVQKVEEKKQEEIKHIETNHCAYRTLSSKGEDLCTYDALEQSPSKYCMKHILLDPRLLEVGIEIPKFIPSKEKKQVKAKVAEQLSELKREGKF